MRPRLADSANETQVIGSIPGGLVRFTLFCGHKRIPHLIQLVLSAISHQNNQIRDYWSISAHSLLQLGSRGHHCYRLANILQNLLFSYKTLFPPLGYDCKASTLYLQNI